MSIRITGMSTPAGGLSWEYTKTEESTHPLLMSSGQKIKVFISSICGVEKYDKVRIGLKNAIESTQLADVYTFEGKGASTLPAGVHYTLALEDSDICIFLIDNADGINSGVQAEIDTVKKYSDEAASIMDFCLNHPIGHKRVSSQWLAFGVVGYFLDDKRFEQHGKIIIGEMKSWLSSEGFVVSIGQNIFKCLSGVAYRLQQDTLSEICCQFIEKHYSRWYIEMFNFIANSINLKKMSTESAQDFIEHINCLLDNEKERKEVDYAPIFLCVLRKQNIVLTEDMDKKVAEYFSEFYKGTYKLETTENEKQDMPVFVREYVDRIKNNNETQGKNGTYFGHSMREIATVRTILLGKEVLCNSETMDMLISAVADTLLVSKEGISIKLDAIALLICIAVKYPEDYKRNQSIYEKLFTQQEAIDVADHSIISSNLFQNANRILTTLSEWYALKWKKHR